MGRILLICALLLLVLSGMGYLVFSIAFKVAREAHTRPAKSAPRRTARGKPKAAPARKPVPAATPTDELTPAPAAAADPMEAYYRPSHAFDAKPTAELERLLAELARRTELSRAAKEFPTDRKSLQRAAAALEGAALDVFSFKLDLAGGAADQLDRFSNAHLIDPSLRPFFLGNDLRRDLDPTEKKSYSAACENSTVPRDPLLYYALGAFWGEWLVLHGRCVWSLAAPLRPIQLFPEPAAVLNTQCVVPFTDVTKKLCEPEVEALAARFSALSANRRCIPPFPLIAGSEDVEAAVREHFSEKTLAALAAEDAGDDERAFTLHAEAIAERPTDAGTLALGVSVAWRLKKWTLVDEWLTRASKASPDTSPIVDNLAALYAEDEAKLPQAIALLERQLSLDPNYGPTHLTLAGCLLDSGRKAEGLKQAQWVVEHDPDLKTEAASMIEEANR
ncbi:MAG: hypothetical protein HYZ53_06110 [Planctomycetes bacterium]|nr:hypothetical protein [Planctomycetota bacterium]